ncbi:DUF3995 domain-containing protein [Olivibacter domesticus]|uniref:DUF3995 domain-containing protein n=1 Tax=Olivibacter domesticus TaxID=407022 RepID=A0A1H7R5A6_OLID1|nr:DUF3995 domain-containing protein [Olivibacter domesticus]SEL55312.1 Protein of unknown function [Olivibacter domesticus]
MKLIAGFIIGVVLVTIAFIHFYWAFGGDWGKDSAIPTDRKGVKRIQPGPVDCLLVGLFLLLCTANTFMGIGMLRLFVSQTIVTWGLWGTAFIFGLRAIGDFKYIGFFKRINDTEFGKRDTSLYSPLCLLLSLLCLVIVMM